MTVDTFIQTKVNTARGGFQPTEVIELIREAWQLGRQERNREITEGLKEVTDERENLNGHQP
jgi:hypothetical protein